MAKDYFQSQEFNEILDSYEKQKEQGQSIYLDAEDFADIADFYLGHDLPELAMEAVEKGLEVHLGDEVLLVMKSATYIFGHQYAAAEAILKSLNEENSDVKYQFAQLQYAYYFNTQKADEIWREWLTMVEDDGGESDEWMRENYIHIISSIVELRGTDKNTGERLWNMDAARKWIKEYIDLFKPLGKSDSDLQLVDICRENGLADLMCEALTLVLETKPYLPKGWSNLALAYFSEQNYEQALEACDFALAVDANDLDALLTKAHTVYGMGHKKESAPVFKEYLEKGGEVVQRIPYAEVLFLNGEDKEAIHQMELLAQHMEGERQEVAGQLEYDEKHLSEEDLQAKRSYYDNFYDLYEKIYTDIGDLYNRNEYFKESMEANQHILVVNAQSSEAYFMLGVNSLALQDYQEATQYFGKALMYAGDQIMMGVDIALTFVLNNYDDFALEVLNSIEKLSKTSSSPFARHIPAAKSLTYLKLGQTDQFLKFFKIACKLTPNLIKRVYEEFFPQDLPVEKWYDYAKQEIDTLLEKLKRKDVHFGDF